VTLFDAKADAPHQRQVKPLEEQAATESLKLWGPCAKAIHDGDYATASSLKTKIEEEQRAIRRKRKDTKEKWQPTLFKFVVPDADDRLGTTAKDPQHSGGEHDDTQGHWVYCGA
jgi:hypothetical protein